jgi:hypothetical protein
MHTGPEPRVIIDDLDRTLSAEFGGEHRPLPRTCLTLLNEAVLSLGAGAYNSAAITSRAAMEAASWHYLFLTWSRTGYAARRIDRTAAVVVARSRLSDLQERIVREGALSEEEVRAFERVKEEGDSVAHLAETTLRLSEQALREWTCDPTQPPPERDPIEPTWATAETSASLIRDCATVILALSRAGARRAQHEHPEWFR